MNEPFDDIDQALRDTFADRTANRGARPSMADIHHRVRRRQRRQLAGRVGALALTGVGAVAIIAQRGPAEPGAVGTDGGGGESTMACGGPAITAIAGPTFPTECWPVLTTTLGPPTSPTTLPPTTWLPAPPDTTQICEAAVPSSYELTGPVHTVVPSNLPIDVQITSTSRSCTGGPGSVRIALTNLSDGDVELTAPVVMLASQNGSKWPLKELQSLTIQAGTTITIDVDFTLPLVAPGTYTVFVYGLTGGGSYEIDGPPNG